MAKIKWSVILENGKNLVEALAVIITGCWVLFLFVIKDTPGYDKSLKLSGDIHIDSVYASKKGYCQANLILDVKNLHPSSVIIDKLIIRLWYFKVDSLAEHGYVNIRKFEDENKPFYSYEHFATAINSYYPPDGEAHDELQFLVNDDKKHGLLCEYTVIGQTTGSFFRKREELTIKGNSWTFKCSPELNK